LKPYRLHFHQSAKAFLFFDSSIFVLNISQYISIGKNINGVQVRTAASVKTMKQLVDKHFSFVFPGYSFGILRNGCAIFHITVNIVQIFFYQYFERKYCTNKIYGSISAR
jgi:hypothetical protein